MVAKIARAVQKKRENNETSSKKIGEKSRKTPVGWQWPSAETKATNARKSQVIRNA